VPWQHRGSEQAFITAGIVRLNYVTVRFPDYYTHQARAILCQIAATVPTFGMRGGSVGWVALTVLVFGLELVGTAAFQSPPPLTLRSKSQLNKTHRTRTPAHLAGCPRIGNCRFLRQSHVPLLQMISGGTEGEGGTAEATDGSEPTQVPFFSPDSPDYPLDYFGESTRGDLLPVPEMMGRGSFMEGEELQDVCDKLGIDFVWFVIEF